jgi:RimJ/RimL family protein N-acetyltransferase
MFGEVTRDEVFRIETRRLWLRWPRLADAAAIQAIASLHAVAKWTARVPHPYPLGEAARFVAQVRESNAAGTGLDLAITEKTGARSVVGMIGVDVGTPNKVSLGFIVAPSHWGKGYASEAVRAIIDAAFQLTPARTVVSCVFAGNAASARVHEKCGFVALGPCEMDVPLRGGRVAVERFSLSRKLWACERPGVDAPQLEGCCA